MKKYNFSKNRGFTLIEIIIVIGIVTGLAFMISTFGIDIFDFGIFLGDNIVSQQELQLTLKVITPEIRSMSQSATGSYIIESATENSLVFYTDIDGDGVAERINYFLDGNVFKKGVTKATGDPLSYPLANENIKEVIHNIYLGAGDIFTYYDQNYTGSESALAFPINVSLIRLIKINLTVDPDPLEPSSRVSYSTLVNIRNL